MPFETREVGQPKSGEASGAGDASLEHVLDRYLEELAGGGSPDQDSYIRANPELADALRGVFKTLDFVEATSRSLNASKLEHGQQLGEFRIIREIGRGGMGVVYEAIQTPLNRHVALKVLPGGALLSENAAERFAREAAAAGKLHHSNIVPVYAIGEEQGIHYYAMQYIEGRSLSEYLKSMRAGRMKPGRDYYRRVAHWGQQVADALAHAHSQGTIHRDIKPSNLLLDARDNVWVTDFGLAREDAMTTITVSGDLLGTARYMSPEQARGGRTNLDGRTDIYSLGATLYELLAMTPAFDGESRDAVLNRIVFEDPTPLGRISPSIPRNLETIVAKCMEKESARRYANAEQVAEDCRRFCVGEPICARRTPAIVKAARYIRRHRARAAVIVLAAALLVLMAFTIVRFRASQGQARLDEAYDAFLLKHDSKAASRLLDEAESWGIDTAKLHLCRGLIPLLRNEPQRSLSSLTRALQRDPYDSEVCYALALAYHSTGDADNGRRFFEQAGSAEPDTALGWLLRGYVFAQTQPGVSFEAYNRALQLRPDFTPAIRARAFYRATRLLAEGARDELQPMLHDYEAWVTFWPDSAGSYSARATGWMYAAAYAATQPDLRDSAPKWLENAEADRRRALEIAPNEMLTIAMRGAILRYQGDFAGAAKAFAEAVEADRAASGDEHPGAVHHLVNALYATGELDRALEEITPAIAALPSFFALTLQRALLLAELGRVDEGRETCREFLRTNYSGASGLTIGGAVMELLGEPETVREAVGEYERLNANELSETTPDRGGVQPELDYLLGRLDAAALMDAAQGHPGWRCEYSFLIGLRELGRGDREAGLAALRNCIDTGVFPYIQYRFAQVFLARAEADPQWPRWAPITRD